MRALIIDDSRAVRVIIRQILNEVGMDVLEAGNGAEALQRMKEASDIELILVDWNMPVMDGLEFIRTIRAQRNMNGVRILMITSESESAQVTRALDAGADEYLMKPFTKEILIAKLNLMDILQEQTVAKIRVLVVDDAVVFRRLVSEELNKDPELEVVGTASNGKIALARIPQVNPDIIILDVEMPEMDGLVTLAEVRKAYARLPVIMFSALTERGASATLDALALGATDYFTKPSCEGGLDASLDVLRTQLIPKIKAFCQVKKTAAPAPSKAQAVGGQKVEPKPVQGKKLPAGPVQILAIGSSTGGPNALAEVFGKLPAEIPVPIVIVQHMPPMFTRLLAERLTSQFRIPVHEGSAGTLLQPGHAYIAPGDYHMIVVRDGTRFRLQIHQEPPENSCRPAVDVLFRSVAQTFRGNSLGVVLTGMGQDGLRGCELLREAGGQVVVQDEASSVVWGMPGHVARAGLADKILPLALIADEILRRLK